MADRADQSYVLQDSAPDTFTFNGHTYLARAPETFSNNNTAWWDASYVHGFDETSKMRAKRDPKDPAMLLLEPVADMPGPRLPARLPGWRSHRAPVGRPGIGGLSGQLVHLA